MLLTLIASGVAKGSIYAIVAVGLTVVYRSTRVLNFGHGEVLMLGGYLAFTVYHLWHLPYAAAALVTLVAGALMGLLLERVTRQPLAAGAMNSVVLATIGIGFAFKGAVRLLWSEDYLTFPPIYGMAPLSLGGLYLTSQDVVLITASLIVMAIFFTLFRLTSFGKQLRASASNRLGAALVGIRVPRMFASAWALSCMLGMGAGLLMAPISLIYPDMGFDVFVKAFAGAVLGGFGSFQGAVAGGILVGIVENLVGGYVATVLAGTAPFIIITAVLILFPSGLFGGVRDD